MSLNIFSGARMEDVFQNPGFILIVLFFIFFFIIFDVIKKVFKAKERNVSIIIAGSISLMAVYYLRFLLPWIMALNLALFVLYIGIFVFLLQIMFKFLKASWA